MILAVLCLVAVAGYIGSHSNDFCTKHYNKRALQNVKVKVLKKISFVLYQVSLGFLKILSLLRCLSFLQDMPQSIHDIFMQNVIIVLL